jgi:hypothetical protein
MDGAVAAQITPLPGGWPLKPGSATLPFFGVQVQCSFVPKSMYYNLSLYVEGPEQVPHTLLEHYITDSSTTFSAGKTSMWYLFSAIPIWQAGSPRY